MADHQGRVKDNLIGKYWSARKRRYNDSFIVVPPLALFAMSPYVMRWSGDKLRGNLLVLGLEGDLYENQQ